MVRKHERGLSLPIPLYRVRYAQLFKVAEGEIWVRSAALPVAIRTTRTSNALHEPLNTLDVASAKAEIPRIVALDNRFGAADIVKMAVRLFRSLQNRPLAATVDSRDLYDVLAEVAELAGWLAYDAELHDLARRMNQESRHYATLAGNRSVELLSLQNMSMHASALGRPHGSLALVELVLEQQLSPRLRALFLIRRARVVAQFSGEPALKELDHARSLFLDGTIEADAQHFWWVDERELAWHEAMVARDLGMPTRSLDLFARSVEATPGGEVRSQYLHRAYLIRAQLESRAWEDADRTAVSLEPLAIEVASTRTDRVLQQLALTLSTVRGPSRIRDRVAHLVSLTANKHVDEEVSA